MAEVKQIRKDKLEESTRNNSALLANVTALIARARIAVDLDEMDPTECPPSAKDESFLFFSGKKDRMGAYCCCVLKRKSNEEEVENLFVEGAK